MHERAYDRFSPTSTVQIIDRLDGTALGVLINVSKGGFMMLSEGNCPEAGEIRQVQLIDHETGDPDISVGATCLWHDEANARHSYWSGFQIIDISPEEQEKLDRYISSLEEAARNN
ncbi:PilZ domain-containing protein [Thiolapillus sp.]